MSSPNEHPSRLALVCAMLLTFVLPAQAQFPSSGQLPLDPRLIPQFVDPLPHFAYPGTRVDATAPGTPLAVEIATSDQQALSTGTILPGGTIVSSTTGLTHVWAYRVSNGTVTRGPHWPAYTIEARRGVPLNVLYLNNLEESYDAVNLAADQTLHWALDTYSMAEYSGPVPAVAHLHGGEVPPWSDGGPDAWYLPFGADAGHAALTNVYYYPNTQEAATLWFHDHALGVTRLNVYAGLAGFYFLRDEFEDELHLPGWSGDGTVQEVDPVTGALHSDAYLPELEVAIQDRMFDESGQLYFPAGIEGGAPNPDEHPFWVPEFAGNIITVNGKTWPYLSVAPRKYRIRLLNGSNARFYELWLENMVTEAMGPTIWQVGSDGGLLDLPASFDPDLGQKLLLGPGERADLVIDFGSVDNPNPLASHAVWTLRNAGNTPFPKGGPPNGATLGRIMQFVVNGEMSGTDNSVITGRTTPLEKLVDYAAAEPSVLVNKTRQLTLNEAMGSGGPLEVLVNNTKWSGHPVRPYNDFTLDPSGASPSLYSELPTEGQTELWQIINLTADAHPIHLHLVQYQLVSRQKFNLNKYIKAYEAAYAAAGVSPMMQDAWGPPLNYNTGTDPTGKKWTDFLGGNPDVTPFLQGPAKSANPNEQGWKDTYIMYPGEVTTVIVRFTPTDANATGKDYFDFNPDGGHGYVWHCHIIDHEDNEMMRPYAVTANGPVPDTRIAAPLYTGYNTTHPDGAAAARTGAEVEAAAESSSLPEFFTLSQNYPNPFNPTTAIRFTLPAECHVTLTVYNSLGRKVSTLIDQDAPAGEHTVQMDARDLPSGVYFYRLEAGSFRATRSMLMLK